MFKHSCTIFHKVGVLCLFYKEQGRVAGLSSGRYLCQAYDTFAKYCCRFSSILSVSRS